MKKNLLKLWPVFLLTQLAFCVSAQRIDTALARLNRDYKQEKIYLQLDRTVYNPGETIWFKAYLFTGSFPSEISKTVYTELIDAKGKVLRRFISPVIISGAAGSLEIPAGASGTVYVRAYTKWMLNFDSAYLFTKAITVIPPPALPGKSVVTPVVQTNATVTNANMETVPQFFPEGGDLINNIESRVAFKVTYRNGMPANASGDIVNNNGKKITSFVSIHDGMGMFVLQPANGETYKAVWNDEQGHAHETNLPPAKQSGIVLEVNSFSDHIQFKIKRNPTAGAYPFVYLVAQFNQQLLYKAKANLTQLVAVDGIIPTENLSAGIVQVTVFSPDEKPIAERIAFINQTSCSFMPRINTSLINTGKRKESVLAIDIPDSIESNLSVAITDAVVTPSQRGENIFSHLLLTSDINGYVHNPSYYFSGDADSIADHLDLVMMTNGWRRFRWENVLAGNFPTMNYKPENYITINGQVQGLGKESLEGKEINGILELKDKKREFLIFPLQQNGKFNFPGMIFYDTATLFYQFNKDKNKTLTGKASFDIRSSLVKEPLGLQPPAYLMLGVQQPDTLALTRNKEIYVEQLNKQELQKVRTLKTVVVTSQKKTKTQLMDEKYTSGMFSDDGSMQSRTILPDEDPSFLSSTNLATYLQGRVAGLLANPDLTEDAITWRGFATALYVNEISQSALSFETGRVAEDATYFLSLPMSDIAMVKIFEPPFFGGSSANSGGQGGAIAVYLKKAGDRGQQVKPLDHVILPGYSPVKEFYSPNYSQLPASDAADYRPTLYWKPFVILDKKHRHISLSFFNNDITQKIKIIIEGCNRDGKLTHIERVLQQN